MNGTVLAILFVGGFILYAIIGTTVVRRCIRRHVAEGTTTCWFRFSSPPA
jgi:uncharacterized membrane protein